MPESSPPLPIERLHGIGIVTDDLERTVEDFSRFFGIGEWAVRRLRSGSGMTIEEGGVTIEGELLLARGEAAGINFDVIVPLGGATLFQDFLVRRGAGVHDLTTHVMEPAAFDAALPELRRNGIGIRQTLKIEDTLDIHYLDTIGQLATTLKVLVPHRPGGEKLEGVPIETELRFATPAANERLPVEQAYHVCINTRHRRLSVQEGFRRLFGIEDWFEFDNESNVTVRDVHYLGNPTDGRFRLICGRRQQFSVEIVEMIFGDSGYQEMLDTKGEGIHHVFTTVCTLERLDEAKRALARDGYTIVQDGANGAIYYGYLGAPGKLAGLNVEMLCPLSDDWTAGADDGFWQILLGSGYQSHPLIGR